MKCPGGKKSGDSQDNHKTKHEGAETPQPSQRAKRKLSIVDLLPAIKEEKGRYLTHASEEARCELSGKPKRYPSAKIKPQDDGVSGAAMMGGGRHEQLQNQREILPEIEVGTQKSRRMTVRFLVMPGTLKLRVKDSGSLSRNTLWRKRSFCYFVTVSPVTVPSVL